MKSLAQYLSEYVSQEIKPLYLERLQEYIEQGIEAYQSTENCSINVSYACECCCRVRNDVKWRNDTEQYECDDCYQWYLTHN